MVRNILFVCTGNTCRSPMAAALLRQLLKERSDELGKIKISSAGLYASPGAPASPEAVEVMRGYGADLSTHLARELEEEELAAADLILTMTHAQKNQMLKDYPSLQDRVFVLKEYLRGGDGVSGPHDDLPDPFGQPVDVYRRCAAVLDKDLRALIQLLASEENSKENTENNPVENPAENSVSRQKGGRKMKIALGSDHAGFALKEEIARYLRETGYEFKDFGVFSTEAVDYPDQAAVVARAVANGQFDQGIIICGTGIGVSMAANKIKGIRAALCHDVFSAQMARAHNDSNVLTMGARVVGPGLALAIVETYLKGEFAGGRHQQRVDKIMKLEE
ncbi:MAG: ribose 5-phosphate isomerase B [Firmicutes bacterium]|nr:ribose 5-phosphate isomerase B [Bacillota bacterium]